MNRDSGSFSGTKSRRGALPPCQERTEDSGWTRLQRQRVKRLKEGSCEKLERNLRGYEV